MPTQRSRRFLLSGNLHSFLHIAISHVNLCLFISALVVVTGGLTAHRSAALAAELVQRPDIALATVVHAFASRILLDGCNVENVLQINLSPQSIHRVERSKPLGQMEAARQKWGGQIPADADNLWTWCLAQDKAVLLDLLAFCAATSIDAVRGKSDRPDAGRLGHADKLAAAVDLDMKLWFTPDAANYFSRVSKP